MTFFLSDSDWTLRGRRSLAGSALKAPSLLRTWLKSAPRLRRMHKVAAAHTTREALCDDQPVATIRRDLVHWAGQFIRHQL